MRVLLKFFFSLSCLFFLTWPELWGLYTQLSFRPVSKLYLLIAGVPQSSWYNLFSQETIEGKSWNSAFSVLNSWGTRSRFVAHLVSPLKEKMGCLTTANEAEECTLQVQDSVDLFLWKNQIRGN